MAGISARGKVQRITGIPVKPALPAITELRNYGITELRNYGITE